MICFIFVFLECCSVLTSKVLLFLSDTAQLFFLNVATNEPATFPCSPQAMVIACINGVSIHAAQAAAQCCHHHVADVVWTGRGKSRAVALDTPQIQTPAPSAIITNNKGATTGSPYTNRYLQTIHKQPEVPWPFSVSTLTAIIGNSDLSDVYRMVLIKFL